MSLAGKYFTEEPLDRPENRTPDNESQAGELFEDLTVARTIREDPVFKFLFKWWRQILTVAVAVVIVFYGRCQFEQARALRMSEASDLYVRLENEFSNLRSLGQELQELKSREQNGVRGDADWSKKVGELEEKIGDSNRRLKELLASLQDTRAPYEGLASLYKVLADEFSGNTKEVSEALNPAHNFAQIESGRPERFFAELKALVSARALLDSGAGFSEGRALLAELAQEGQFVNVAAAVSLARISLSPEEKSAAAALLEKVVSAHPEQAELLDEEIQRMRG